MDRREINHFIKVEYTLRFPKNIVLGKSMIGKHSVFYWYSEISKDFVRVAVFYNFRFCAVKCERRANEKLAIDKLHMRKYELYMRYEGGPMNGIERSRW